MDRRNEELFLESEGAVYGIYQIKRKSPGENYAFMSMEYVEKHGFEIRKEDYSLVWQDELKDGEDVETLFEKFNLHIPEGFKGHSLSVSDIVVFKKDGECKAFYIDNFGSVPVPGFIPDRKRTEKGENREDEKSLVVHTRLSGDTKVVLDIQQYADNDNIYIGLICDDEDREPFCNLTVNLGGELPNFCGYVDTNHLEEAEDFIVDNCLGTFSGLIKTSGFCDYPLYSFHPERLRELCPEGMALYEKAMGIEIEPQERAERR